jgi:hypothetical protein
MATLDDRFDVLLAIDWQNLNRFGDEIPIGGQPAGRRQRRRRRARGLPGQGARLRRCR